MINFTKKVSVRSACVTKCKFREASALFAAPLQGHTESDYYSASEILIYKNLHPIYSSINNWKVPEFLDEICDEDN